MHRSLQIAGLLLLIPVIACAFPPAPHHTIYGMARDELGNPLISEAASIQFRTPGGVIVSTRINPDIEPGINYILRIPMDAGIAPDLYQPTAMLPLVPFRLRVQIGAALYLPIQMQGDYASLGKPAESTRIDLTLGIDSDGDGIPDAWKDMVARMLGLTREDIRAGADLSGKGMTALQEYIAGTYPWDPEDRLWLDIIGMEEGKAVLEFLAIDRRTYTIYGSTDLQNWEVATFRLPALDAPDVVRSRYFSPDVRRLEVEVDARSPEDKQIFFKLEVR